MAKMVQKTFKLPEEWAKELTKRVGEKMAKTGVECSFASYVKDLLDEHCNLSDATGIDSEGAEISGPKRSDPVAKTG